MARFPIGFRPGGLQRGFAGDPFLSLHREMNRLFDDVLRGSSAPSPQGGGEGGVMVPHLDVSETEKELRVCAELPGVSEKDVEVTLNNDLLTIRGEKQVERQEEREDFHVTERMFGTFQRSLRLPFPVDPDKVEAAFENGVLKVRLPKSDAQERARRIQVQGRGGGQAGQETGQAQSGGKRGQSGEKGEARKSGR